MFLNRRKNQGQNEVMNGYDIDLKYYAMQIEKSAAILAERVVDAYVKKVAVDCYENSSADYNKAKEDYEKATHLINCAIGAYDGHRASYESYKLAYRHEFSKIPENFPTSHELIEITIRKIILKNS